MRLQELFDRYYNKTASVAERQELMQLIKGIPGDQLADLIRESGENMGMADYSLSPETINAILQNIFQTNPLVETVPLKEFPEKRRIIRTIFSKKNAFAASIILGLGIGSYFVLFNTKKHSNQSVVSQQSQDAGPGSFKAKLKLADGSTIILDSMTPGKLAQQNNTSIINSNGKLVYSNASSITDPELLYNTLTTNKGETYSLALADGSTVWLNAASSIRFPVAFSGKERRIEITGEVYVKVAKNTRQPFIVSANDMEVRALGTEFNINAYSDEATMNTTLVEGSVKVSGATVNTSLQSGNQSLILKQSQQARFANGNIIVEMVDIEEIISWKEGWFHFESASLKTVLRQFARWYDVEVVYEGPITDRKFFGIVKRNNTLLNVLEMLNDNEIKFRIAGKKLYVVSG